MYPTGFQGLDTYAPGFANINPTEVKLTASFLSRICPGSAPRMMTEEGWGNGWL